MITLAIIAFVCAAIPCLLFVRNSSLYAPPPAETTTEAPSVSLLIPARDEEGNIEGAVKSALANERVDVEVIVLDDHSTDRTRTIVEELAHENPRVRLERCPELPVGWCGKQHACWVLARLANHPVLVFMDADVRLAPDGLAKGAGFLRASGAALASGVPRQVLGSFWEGALLPLIHFVLLGFLPLNRMRHSRHPAYSAGCGQLFFARADAYQACGGHGQIRESLHDGVKLPRVFRAAGYHTDLFDATDVASCRMYHGARQVFAGLAKNATEGLAAPARIAPVTILLLFGQVLPFGLLCWGEMPTVARLIAALACVTALAPRALGARLFKQPIWSAMAHPIAIVALLAIQWFALASSLVGRPSRWRGRAYAAGTAAVFLLCATGRWEANGADVAPLQSFSLPDQFERTRHLGFPRTNASFLVVADWKGSEQLGGWIKPVHDRVGGKIGIEGVANVSAVPPGLRGFVRRAFVKQLDYPVMLDWSGNVTKQLNPQKDTPNVLVISREGKVLLRLTGAADSEKLRQVFRTLEMP